MNIVKLNTLLEVKKAFDDVKDVFPNLYKRVNIDEYLNKIYKFGNVFAPYDCVNDVYCGIAAVYMNDTENKKAYITLIGIAKLYRQQHLGTRLISYCESEAKNANMKYMYLEVDKNNVNAINFYIKNKYQYCDYDTENSWYLYKEL